MEKLIIVAIFLFAVGVALEAVVATVRARKRHHMDFKEGP
jgi:hypothetical protein